MRRFHNGILIADATVELRNKPLLPGVISTHLTRNQLKFLDKVRDYSNLSEDAFKDNIAQVRWSSECLFSTDLCNDGMKILRGTEQVTIYNPMMDLMPISLFKGKDKWSRFTVRMPYNPREEDRPWDGGDMIELHVTITDGGFKEKLELLQEELATMQRGIGNGPKDAFTDRLWIRTSAKWQQAIYVCTNCYATNDKVLWDLPDSDQYRCRPVIAENNGFLYLFYRDITGLTRPVAFTYKDKFFGDTSKPEWDNSLLQTKAWWN